MSLRNIQNNLLKFADPKRAEHSKRFFKTGKGEYGEGDIFLGLTTPQIVSVVRNYFNLTLPELQKLLNSKIHEHRCAALIILCHQYKKAGDLPAGRQGERVKERIFNFYLKNTKNINNWDLVDISCPTIIGGYLLGVRDRVRVREVLYGLARSKSLWERRIAIISTAAFIRENQFEDTLKISEILLNDKQDLIHKAVGWMLREVGKRNIGVLENFLDKNIIKMPRTMLRYAIEKFPEEKRKMYLNKLHDNLTI